MHNYLGFVKNWQILNVSITRAKHVLIIIGNSNTLRFDSYWD